MEGGGGDVPHTHVDADTMYCCLLLQFPRRNQNDDDSFKNIFESSLLCLQSFPFKVSTQFNLIDFLLADLNYWYLQAFGICAVGSIQHAAGPKTTVASCYMLIID